MLVDLAALINHVVTVETLVALHELVLRLVPAPLVELARLRNQVLLSTVALLSDSLRLLEGKFYEGHFFAKRVDFDHFLEVSLEAIVVFLAKVSVFAGEIKVKLDIFFIQPEELLFHDVVM